MTGRSSISTELADLLERLCLDELLPADADRLEELIRANDEACRQYIVFMHIHALAERFEGTNFHREARLLEKQFSEEADAVISVSSPAASPVLGFLGHAVHDTVAYFSQGMPFSYLVAALLVGCGLLIGWLVPVSRPAQVVHTTPQPEPLSIQTAMQFVGRITGMADCTWADESTAVAGYAAVPLGRKYALAAGLLEITYDSGAKVILQGPVTYEVDSADGGYLSVGRLTARVEKKEERRPKNDEVSDSRSSFLISHSYFAVRTPTATVTDLGTEFGVEVNEGGRTTSHVFRGSVRVQLAGGGKEAGEAGRVVQASESAVVEPSNGKIDEKPRITVAPLTDASKHFVRALPRRTMKTLDLVDVVAGGNGYGNARHRGINPNDGQVVDRPPPDGVEWEESRTDNRYHRVEDLPFVDGVFVPDDRRGPVQLDSAGHMADGLGTSDDRVFGYIWAGGEIPAPLPPTMRTCLGGIDYGSPGHGILGMVADKGITFDLDAIRRANPDCQILRFRAVTGNTEPTAEYERYATEKIVVVADVSIFVDGQLRFQRRKITGRTGAIPIQIPLTSRDRFLTLVASDGGDTISYDWIVFGDPRLELSVLTDPNPQTEEVVKE